MRALIRKILFLLVIYSFLVGIANAQIGCAGLYEWKEFHNQSDLLALVPALSPRERLKPSQVLLKAEECILKAGDKLNEDWTVKHMQLGLLE